MPDDENVSALTGADTQISYLCYTRIKKSTNRTTGITGLGFNRRNRIKLNRIFINKNLENYIENFWKIDSQGSKKDVKLSLQPRNEKITVDILEKPVTKIDGHYSLGLLWRAEFPNLLNNRTLAFSRFLSLEKIFNNNPEFHIKYHKTIKVYI